MLSSPHSGHRSEGFCDDWITYRIPYRIICIMCTFQPISAPRTLTNHTLDIHVLGQQDTVYNNSQLYLLTDNDVDITPQVPQQIEKTITINGSTRTTIITCLYLLIPSYPGCGNDAQILVSETNKNMY